MSQNLQEGQSECESQNDEALQGEANEDVEGKPLTANTSCKQQSAETEESGNYERNAALMNPPDIGIEEHEPQQTCEGQTQEIGLQTTNNIEDSSENISQERKEEELAKENENAIETGCNAKDEAGKYISLVSTLAEIAKIAESACTQTEASITPDSIIIENINVSRSPAITELGTSEIQQKVSATGHSTRNLTADSQSPSVVVVAPLLSTSSLGLLATQYDSSSDNSEDSLSTSDESSDSEDSVLEVSQLPAIGGPYRSGVIEIPSGSESDSDLEFVKQSEGSELAPLDIEMLEEDDYTGSKSRGPVRVKGELALEDLPPIQDLHITIPENECVELGKIHSIIDQLVLVESHRGTAPLNLDTVLFLDKGQKVLGEVFDVLGQVNTPLYCVRFNTNKQIIERGVELGQIVYIAPRTEHTHFVIIKDMMRLRGSDASWENDIEPNERHLDYSDDEEERTARRAMRNRDRGGEETESNKRQRPEQSISSNQHQHTPRPPPRQQYQRPPRYRGNYPGDVRNREFQYSNFNQMYQPPGQYPAPFNYGPSNASWHANFNHPPPPQSSFANHYSNPYAYNPHFQQQGPFIPGPDAMQQSLFPPPQPPQ